MTSFFGWPFAVDIAGDARVGAPATLTVTGATLADELLRGRLQLSVNTFAELASYGGLGGSSLNPVYSSARLADSKPQMHPNRIVWRFSSLAIDPRAVTVLLNALEGCEASIDTVTLQTSGSDTPQPVGVEDYPEITNAIPFSLQYEMPSRNVDAEAIFFKPVNSADEEKIIRPILTWRLVGFLGGFRRANLLPLASNFFPVGEPEIVEDALTVHLENCTAHQAAFDSLVNVLVWISEQVAPIEQVTIT